MLNAIERSSKIYADNQLKGVIGKDIFYRIDKMKTVFDYSDIQQAFKDGVNWMQDYQDAKYNMGEEWIDIDVLEPEEHRRVLFAFKNICDLNRCEYNIGYRFGNSYWDMQGRQIKSDLIWWTNLDD